MINFGNVPLGAILPIMFTTYAGATGASVTLTGLAVTDIEIYSGTSMTQRASDAGYTLMDTDGIDIDSVTGLHGFSVDTGDNTTAGFFAAGSFYTVVVSAVTVDAQTVNFVAATFRVVAAEATAGVPVANATQFAGQTITAAAGVELPAVVASTTNITQVGLVTGNVGGSVVGNLNGNVAGNVNGNVLGTVASVVGAVGSVTGLTAANLDVAVSTRLATAGYTAPDNATITAIAGYIDTEVGAIKAKTDLIPASPAAVSDIPTAAANADAIWDEAIAGHATAGSTGAALSAAGSAGDPWSTALPGAYGAGTAGKIVGDNINATVSSRATQTSVDDVPTNAELTTALGTADDAVLAQVALVKTKTDLIPAAPSAVGDIPTAAENADKILGRNLASGSDGGRTVKDALRSLRNKSVIAAGTLTVYLEDDTTSAWTAAVTTTAGDPLSSIDPA